MKWMKNEKKSEEIKKAEGGEKTELKQDAMNLREVIDSAKAVIDSLKAFIEIGGDEKTINTAKSTLEVVQRLVEKAEKYEKEEAERRKEIEKMNMELEELRMEIDGGNGKMLVDSEEFIKLKTLAEEGAEASIKLKKKEAEEKVKKLESEGKIVPTMRDYALMKALNDPEEFEEFAKGLPVIAPQEKLSTSVDTEKPTDLDSLIKAKLEEKGWDISQYPEAYDLVWKENPEIVKEYLVNRKRK